MVERGGRLLGDVVGGGRRVLTGSMFLKLWYVGP